MINGCVPNGAHQRFVLVMLWMLVADMTSGAHSSVRRNSVTPLSMPAEPEGDWVVWAQTRFDIDVCFLPFQDDKFGGCTLPAGISESKFRPSAEELDRALNRGSDVIYSILEDRLDNEQSDLNIIVPAVSKKKMKPFFEAVRWIDDVYQTKVRVYIVCDCPALPCSRETWSRLFFTGVMVDPNLRDHIGVITFVGERVWVRFMRQDGPPVTTVRKLVIVEIDCEKVDRREVHANWFAGDDMDSFESGSNPVYIDVANSIQSIEGIEKLLIEAGGRVSASGGEIAFSHTASCPRKLIIGHGITLSSAKELIKNGFVGLRSTLDDPSSYKIVVKEFDALKKLYELLPPTTSVFLVDPLTMVVSGSDLSLQVVQKLVKTVGPSAGRVSMWLDGKEVQATSPIDEFSVFIDGLPTYLEESSARGILNKVTQKFKLKLPDGSPPERECSRASKLFRGTWIFDFEEGGGAFF